jgi:tRNA dimethylallyltransferase
MAKPLSRSAHREPPAANKKNRVIFIVGPTAVGKSEIAVALASKVNAEIISCDSMQVYKKMKIATQKPSAALRRRVKHHLISIISPAREYSAADYQKQAHSKVKEIIKKGKFPLFVGGSGFYMSILLDGIFKGQTKDKKIRGRLYRKAGRYGREKLYRELAKVDPQAALKIHPHDLRRIVRALEVYEKTRVPISELQKQRKGVLGGHQVQIFCLNRDREDLYRRIDRRVDVMFRQGLVREAKGLLDGRLSQTASQAIGINEIKGYYDGQFDLEEAKRLIKRNSRHYAKRQLSWFRRDKRIDWIVIRPKESIKDIVKKIYGRLG